jgi:hypothetical protein
LNRPITYTVLLLICVVSRLLTSVNYQEDPQSLAISMDVINEDFFSSFRNFNSPLFCLLVKSLSAITHNFSVSFSIVGGISTFLIIYFTLGLIKVPLISLEGGLTACLIFFNPLIWIAANRHTPDLASAAIIIVSFYLLLVNHENKYADQLGWGLAGLAGGFGLLLFPFLIAPLLYAGISKKKLFISLLAFVTGIAFWLLPAILLSTPAAVYDQVRMHYFSYPEGMVHYNFYRMADIIRNVWAGGLGGYWWERSPFTIVISIFVLPCLFFGTMILLSFEYPRRKILTVLSSFLLFLAWIYFCPVSTNISIVLLLPFLLIIISYGIIYFLVNFNFIAVKAGVLIYLICNIWISIYLALEHQQPNAVEQLRSHLSQNISPSAYIISSSSELCHFLNLQNNQYTYTPGDYKSEVVYAFRKKGVISPASIPAPKSIYSFSHNPFINSKWSHLKLYEY